MPDHYNALAAACRKARMPRKPILARPASQDQIEDIRRRQLENAAEEETRTILKALREEKERTQ